MRPRAGVQQDAILRLTDGVELFAELPLVVRLEERRLEAELDGPPLHADLELGKGDGRVVLRVAAAELVEVDAVHDRDASPHAATSSTAARRRSSSISCPGVTSPGASTSTNGTLPPARVLSRARH